jgi:hypothetical protein
MKRPLVCVFLFGLLTPTAWADTACEVERLLGFIEKSQCTFVRNGYKYDAADARAHIQRKYDYIEDRVETTEQVIKYAATESSMSGEPYSVICSGLEEPSAEWLIRELARIRAASECKRAR